MAAKLKWRGEQAKRSIRMETAERLLAAMKVVQKEAKRLFGVAYPPASKPGQFPRKRTGNLIRSIIIAPNTAGEIARRQLRCGLGYGPRAPYGPILEDHRGRLGLMEVIRRNRTQIVAALKTPRRRGMRKGER